MGREFDLNEIFAKHFATFQTPKEAGGHFDFVRAPFVPNLFLFCKKKLDQMKLCKKDTKI